MSQNLISLNYTPERLARIDGAFAILREEFDDLIELSPDQRRALSKMGDKSEAFCRQTLIVLTQNRNIIPAELDLAEAENDLRTLDLLRPRFALLRQLTARADDTEMALGSDLLSAMLDGYALAKVFVKGAALDALKAIMAVRFARKAKKSETAAD